ncbi:MAG: magnesium/cobalt transporter CorA [Desulfobulbaceae bacterium]|uniref:Magnesium transport protein CorA n=1 Tax=Candidatus Desulfobia pelagia TaxID=2841692 RepID=A0A8J6NAC3_9BACT|nr:magnesium/cobalt transporter CorA [Candidatus Desulfobia pelagia]
MISLSRPSALKAGLPPGTPIYTGGQTETEINISIVDYDKEKATFLTSQKIEDCALYKDKSTVTWINIDGLHHVNLVEKLCSCFELHPLTVEDILNTTQRPKVDVFDDYVYLVLRMHHHNEETGEINSEQVSFVLGKTFLLTFQETAGDSFDSVRIRIKQDKGRIRKMGTDYLAYVLMDSIVDNYFTVLEKVGEDMEVLEDELVEKPSTETMQTIHFMKREMILLRKSIWPLRDMVSSLRRDEIPQISPDISMFLNDLYDHTIQVMDTIETYRDMISGMLDIYLSSISNRMNEIMKVLTLFAAIFIPLTFIAGIYGMNFNAEKSPLNMPELGWYYGYPFALGLMAVVGVGMLIYFKTRKWF